MFLLPWAVAASFLMVKVAWPARLLFFIGAMVVQGVLLFTVIPAGATSEMMGIARRLRREFPPDQIRTCAATLLQKQHDGILAVRQEKRDQGTVLVDDSELPIPLRGKFERVFIEEQRVYFSLNRRTGILCDSRKHVREFSECSMADGVHAYRYERQ
jgi:hypothetical protein